MVILNWLIGLKELKPPARYGSNVSASPIGQTGLKMGWFPLGNGECLIMKKTPSDSPIWQLKKGDVTVIIFSNHKT